MPTTLTKIVQTPAVALYSSLSTSGSSMIITPYPVDLDGVKLTMSDFGSVGYATIDPKVSGYEEIISFTGLTDNGDGTATLTGLTRDLQSKYPYTGTGTGKQHGSSAVVVFSNNPQVMNKYPARDNDEVITGSWTFNSAPIVLSATPASATAIGNVRTSVAPSTTMGTPTVTIASPAVFTLASHGLTLNDSVQFTTTGALPTGLSLGVTYYVISAGLTANAFEVSTAPAGTAVNTSGTQSGTHTVLRTTPIAVGNDDTRIPSTAVAAALAGNGGTPSGANLFVTQLGAIDAVETFGDGSDGNVTISVPTTLTRDMYYNNLTVNSALTPNGYRIFVKGTISGNGSIVANGANGGAGSGGSAGVGAATTAAGLLKDAPGANGGATNVADGNPGLPGQSGNIGNNGAIGASSANKNGGAGGTVTQITKPNLERWAVLMMIDGDFTKRKLAGSGGGASGCLPGNSGGSGITGGGGGGAGASGGFIWVAARIWAGSFTVIATGGNGGNAGNSSGANMVGGNGAAGGNGGLTFFIYGTKTWTGAYTLTPGTGGTGGTGAAGTGATGPSGNAGTSYEIPIISLI